MTKILTEFNLIHLNDWSLLYNTAENNDKLWKVKAHIVIMPVRLPDGLPEDDKIDDFRLLSNGQLVNLKERLPQVSLRFWSENGMSFFFRPGHFYDSLFYLEIMIFKNYFNFWGQIGNLTDFCRNSGKSESNFFLLSQYDHSYFQHVGQLKTNPARKIKLCDGCYDPNCISNGICGMQMKFGHNLTHWKKYWQFEGT